MSNSNEQRNKEIQQQRNKSEQLGEKYGDHYLRERGYINRLKGEQKGIKQGHDATYTNTNTRSAELDRYAQIVRERKQGGHSNVEIKEAKRGLKHYQNEQGYIPHTKQETVVAEFKGGSSKESRSQEQPDWSIKVAEDIRARKGIYKKASDAERPEAEEVLKAHREGRLRYEVVSSKEDKHGNVITKGKSEGQRTIKPAEHDGLYGAKSQKSLDNIETLRSYRERLKDASERGDTKQEKELRDKIQKDLPEQKQRIVEKQAFTFKTKERLLKRKLENAIQQGNQEKEKEIRGNLQEHYKQRLKGAVQRGDKKEIKKGNREIKKSQPKQNAATKQRSR